MGYTDMPTTELLLQDEYDFPDEKELEQIEYLELESLITTVVERLDAEWSFDAEEEVYLIDISDEDSSESVSVYASLCEEGYNEGRDLLICDMKLGHLTENEEAALELLSLSGQLILSRIYLNQDNVIVLSACTLAQDANLDLVTAMVEEIAAFASIFREELEGL